MVSIVCETVGFIFYIGIMNLNILPILKILQQLKIFCILANVAKITIKYKTFKINTKLKVV